MNAKERLDLGGKRDGQVGGPGRGVGDERSFQRLDPDGRAEKGASREVSWEERIKL